MNKTELINAVAEASELSKKDATKAVDAVFDTILESLKKVTKFNSSVLETLKCVSVQRAKVAILKLVKKLKFRQAKCLRLNQVKLLKMQLLASNEMNAHN